jgi:hypothetical protein
MVRLIESIIGGILDLVITPARGWKRVGPKPLVDFSGMIRGAQAL